jgi:YbbR domain-containing protein
VPNVELDPDNVFMSINVIRDDDFRDLSVKVEYTGTVASGYRIAAVEVTPQIIQVTGPKSALEQLEGFVSTEVINIDSAQADVIRDALLMLPTGITPRGQQLVKVIIKVEAIQGSGTLTATPIIVGLQANLNARISPETVDVLLVGALPVLDRVDLQEEVRLILDLSELGIGTHQVEPRVEVPEGIFAQSLTPPTIRVIIERGPPRTPTPSATPGS